MAWLLIHLFHDVFHAQFVQDALQKAGFVAVEALFGLFFEHGQDVDGMLGYDQILFGRARFRIG